MVCGRGCGLGVEVGRAVGTAIGSPKLLRDAHVISTPRSELRRKHADAAAVADLVNGVGHVDHVEPDRDWLSVPAIGELMRQCEIDLPICREVVAVWAAVRGCTQAGPVDKGCTRSGAVQPRVSVSPAVGNPARTRYGL